MELHIEENFFGLNEAQNLAIKPLTIIIGKNGTGKTRLLNKVKQEHKDAHYLSIEERIQFAAQAKNLESYRALIKNPELLEKVSRFYEAHFGMTLGTQDGELIFRKERQGISLNEIGLTESSLLPILINAYSSETLPIQIINQPELMLYPALAAEVAEAVASSAMNKIQHRDYVIETHSRDFILRLRALVAEGKLNPESLVIYYLDNEKEGILIDEITVNEAGDVSSWPDGFFSSTLNETIRIRTAQLEKTEEED